MILSRSLPVCTFFIVTILSLFNHPNVAGAQDDPVIRPIEMASSFVSNPGWYSGTGMAAAPWKSGFIMRMDDYKSYHDASGPAAWPFPNASVSIADRQIDFFTYSGLQNINGYFYAIIPSAGEQVLAKYEISTGAIQQQALDVKKSLVVAQVDQTRNRLILEEEDENMYYVVDLQTMTILKKIAVTHLTISHAGRYICWGDHKYLELDPMTFKRSSQLETVSAEAVDLASVDFFSLAPFPKVNMTFLTSAALVNIRGISDALFCESNRQFYKVYYHLGYGHPEEADTLYYVSKVELATGRETRVFESEYKIEYAVFSEDYRTLAVYINKDRPTKQLQERPAKLQRAADDRKALAEKLAADSLQRVQEEQRLLAVAEARRKAVADSIDFANYIKERDQRHFAEQEAKRLAEEKRIAERNAVIREKFVLRTSLRNQPLEKTGSPQPAFSDRGIGVYSGFQCADRNDEAFYAIFDKEFFTVYDSLTLSVTSYRYPFAVNEGRRDIRQFHTGYFLMLDYALGHVYIVDVYRGVIKAKVELTVPGTPIAELSMIPGKTGLLFLNHRTYEQVFYSQRSDSLCFESAGLIDITKFYPREILKHRLFPDYSIHDGLCNDPEKLEKLIAEGFTFVYNNDNSRVFSVKKNDFEELDPYERTRLKGEVRFEGYNGRLFGANGYDYMTTWIDGDNIPESYVRERKDGIGFRDNYKKDNDLLLIHTKWAYPGHCFYALNGQIIESSSLEVVYYTMQNPGLINHGMTPGNWSRLVVMRDSLSRPWLLKMNHLSVLKAHLLVDGQKAALNKQEMNALFGEVTLVDRTDLSTGRGMNELREQYVEQPKEVKQVESAVDPNKLYEKAARMEGFSESGMRIELQVRVTYTVKIEKDPVFGGTQSNRYPQAYDVIHYRLPATGDKWLPCSSDITTCGFDNGTAVSPVQCIVVGGIAYRLFNPEYYD